MSDIFVGILIYAFSVINVRKRYDMFSTDKPKLNCIQLY